jgi:CheY-like chemotaxis protein
LPDLVLLDLNMPNVDGRQVLHEMREDRQLQMIPVVVLTTSEAVTDVMMSYALGANAFVVKSFDFDTFCESIGKLCEFWFTVAVFPPK